MYRPAFHPKIKLKSLGFESIAIAAAFLCFVIDGSEGQPTLAWENDVSSAQGLRNELSPSIDKSLELSMLWNSVVKPKNKKISKLYFDDVMEPQDLRMQSLPLKASRTMRPYQHHNDWNAEKSKDNRSSASGNKTPYQLSGVDLFAEDDINAEIDHRMPDRFDELQSFESKMTNFQQFEHQVDGDAVIRPIKTLSISKSASEHEEVSLSDPLRDQNNYNRNQTYIGQESDELDLMDTSIWNGLAESPFTMENTLKSSESTSASALDEMHTSAASSNTMPPLLKQPELSESYENGTGNLLWSNRLLVENSIGILSSAKSGDEILSARVKSKLNETLLFSCDRPEQVFCATDFMPDGSSRLRVVLASDKSLSAFDLPVSIARRTSDSEDDDTEMTAVRFHFVIVSVNFESPNAGSSEMEEPESGEHTEPEDAKLEGNSEVQTNRSSSGYMFSNRTKADDENFFIQTTAGLNLYLEAVESNFSTISPNQTESTAESVSTWTEQTPHASNPRNSFDDGFVIETVLSKPSENRMLKEARVSEPYSIGNMNGNLHNALNEVSSIQSTPSAPAPVKFSPHFRKAVNAILIYPGFYEEPHFLSEVIFFGHSESSPPRFNILNDKNNWFEIGSIIHDEDENYMTSRLKILLRAGSVIEASTDSNQTCSFYIQAIHKNFTVLTKFEAKVTPNTAVNDQVVDLTRKLTELRSLAALDRNSTSILNETDEMVSYEHLEFLKQLDDSESAKSDDEKEIRGIIKGIDYSITRTTDNWLPLDTDEQVYHDPAVRNEAVVSEMVQQKHVFESILMTSPTMSANAPAYNKKISPISSIESNNRIISITEGISSATTTHEIIAAEEILHEMSTEQNFFDSQLLTMVDESPGTPDTVINIDFNLTGTNMLYIWENLKNGEIVPNFRINITAGEMDPNDVIVITTNSTAFDFLPQRMQPGKTVYLIVKDTNQIDFEKPEKTLIIQVTASMRSRPSVFVTKLLKIFVKDSSDNAPKFLSNQYVFNVSESSITGQKVGEISIEDRDEVDKGTHTFKFFGFGSHLFTVSEGILSIACPNILPCLDREQTSTYDLMVIAIDRGGLSSIPTSVRILIDDENDNGPMIHATQKSIVVSNGHIEQPFILKVKDIDTDVFHNNELIVGGNASSFFILEQIRNDIHIAKMKSVPEIGNYELEIIVQDPELAVTTRQKMTVPVKVKNVVNVAHFKRDRYERTLTQEKFFRGNPILQPEFEGGTVDTVRFVILLDNPGWLKIDEYTGNVFVGDISKYRSVILNGYYTVSIGAINLMDGRIISETILRLNVVDGSRILSVFEERFMLKIIPKDSSRSRLSISLVPEGRASKVVLDRDTIRAIDSKLHALPIYKNAIILSQGNIVLDMEKLSNLRSIWFRLSSSQNASDTAHVSVILSSDPTQVALERLEKSRPKFILPWKVDMNLIQVKLAEGSPKGRVVLTLPAFNLLDASQVTNLRLSGEMSEYFMVTGETGDISVVEPLDYETLPPKDRIFDLILTAGIEPYEAVACLRMELVDIDDNPPQLQVLGDLDLDNLTIAENSLPGTILLEMEVTDPDYLYGSKKNFKFTLYGEGSMNFQVREMAETIAVVVSPAADLDHEKFDYLFISISVVDSGGNGDSISIVVKVLDLNDNIPRFRSNSFEVEAVENWPRNTVLTLIDATDKDMGDNGRIKYSLTDTTDDYFEIDEDTGVIRTARPLIGMARAQPYDIYIKAQDQGTPSLSSSARLTVRVMESIPSSRKNDDKEVHIIDPPLDKVLELDENTPSYQRVYAAKAIIGKFSEQSNPEIKYSITPVDSKTDDGWFTIDPTSGELFTLRTLDHETQNLVTVSFTDQIFGNLS